MNFNICHYSQKAFTLMEMLISMVVISILMAASVPMITQFSSMKTGVDKNTIDCIKANESSSWYDTDGAGATSLPAAGSSCYAAVVDAQFNRGRALNTVIWYADPMHGTSDQQSMAKKILRAACDLGGDKACDYFVNECLINGSSSSPYCNDTSAFTDITYYMNLDKATYHNSGANYLLSALETILPKMNQNLLNEVFADCAADSSSIACDLAKNSIYIQGCNRGNTQACEYAYDNSLNKSCYQIKQAWDDAPTGTYKLTYNGAGSPVSVACNMYSVASAAITGCNASPYVSLDCTYGWNNSYNRTCDQISAIWQYAPSGTYNLTSNGAPPTDPVSAECIGLNPDCTSEVGSVCLDGTRYAGTYGGKYYFTTLTDANGGNSTYWNNGTLGFIVGANNGSDGQVNTNTLVNATDDMAPYQAANACHNMTFGGHDDWYLPAPGEFSILGPNMSALGYPSTRYDIITSAEQSADTPFFALCENDSCSAWQVSGNCLKSSSAKYKCMRRTTTKDATCANVLDDCSDGTKYLGIFNTAYYYITPNLYDGLATWSNGTIKGAVSTGATSNTNGLYNTQLLLSKGDSGDSGAPYLGARVCNQYNLDNYKGHTDWFLPAYQELELLWQNRSVLDMTAFPYMSSTELSSRTFYVRYLSGAGYYYKNNGVHARCVRKQDAVATSCTSSPGSMCPDGTYYVGYYNNRYIFAAPADEAGTYSWSAGGVTGATDSVNGNNNMITITALGISSYPAFNACKSLNDVNFKGHSDWYLPADGEASLISAQMSILGLAGLYWSSTENSTSDAHYINTAYPGSVFSYGTKWTTGSIKVRCVRDE